MNPENLSNQAKAADALKEVILEYGRALVQAQERLDSLLRSRAPEAAQEIAALMAAVSEGIPVAFRRRNQPGPIECSEMVSGLIQRKGLSPDLASWTFSAWWSVLCGQPAGQQTAAPTTPPPLETADSPHGFSAHLNAGKQARAKNRGAAPLPPWDSAQEKDLLLRGAQEIKSGKPADAAGQSTWIIARRSRFKGSETVIAGLVAQGIPQQDVRVLVGYALKDKGSLFIPGLAWALAMAIFSWRILRSPDEVAFAVVFSVMGAAVWAVLRRHRTRKSRELLGQYAGNL